MRRFDRSVVQFNPAKEFWISPHTVAKADNNVVFVEDGFSLLSHENVYRIAHDYEPVGRQRLTDSLNSWAATKVGGRTVDATIVGLIVFACTFAGALLGMWLRTILPERQFDAESRDTVKVGIGLIATMTALVLGLVTASAKSSFDAVDTEVKQTATQLLTLDRVLARYGAETGEIRKGLQRTVGARIEIIWPQGSFKPASQDPMRSGAVSGGERLADAIRDLKPHNDSQRALQARALDLVEAMLQARWLLVTGSGTSVPAPFLAVLLFWLTITFTSFGLFAPRNAMVVTVLFVCALSVGSAVFLVLEMDGPFDGLLKVSADPLRHAQAHMNQ